MDLMYKWTAFIEHSLYIEHNTKCNAFSHGAGLMVVPQLSQTGPKSRADLASWLYHLSFRKTSLVILSYFLIIFRLTTTTIKKRGCLEAKLPPKLFTQMTLHSTTPPHIAALSVLVLSPAHFLHSTHHHLRHSSFLTHFVIICLCYPDTSSPRVGTFACFVHCVCT